MHLEGFHNFDTHWGFLWDDIMLLEFCWFDAAYDQFSAFWDFYGLS